jgi:hypothetical protein
MESGWLSEKLNDRKVSRETLRNYVGASSIGSECLRQIYYEFNHENKQQIPAKLQRTFDIGGTLEGLITTWLTECGLELELPSESNDFLEYSSKKVPYFRGHCDALILKPHSVLEIKTAKDASFTIFERKGCKDWNIRYYAQVQSYMGMSNINKACILVLNKDTSEICDEVIDFDKHYYEGLLARAVAVFNAIEPPPKINNSPYWFQCKMCWFKDICHE